LFLVLRLVTDGEDWSGHTSPLGAKHVTRDGRSRIIASTVQRQAHPFEWCAGVSRSALLLPLLTAGAIQPCTDRRSRAAPGGPRPVIVPVPSGLFHNRSRFPVIGPY